jgi:hypothetical protein
VKLDVAEKVNAPERIDELARQLRKTRAPKR